MARVFSRNESQQQDARANTPTNADYGRQLTTLQPSHRWRGAWSAATRGLVDSEQHRVLVVVPMLVGVAGEPFSAAAQAAFRWYINGSRCLTSERAPAIVAGQNRVVKCARGSAAACAADRAVARRGCRRSADIDEREVIASRRGRTMAARPFGERLVQSAHGRPGVTLIVPLELPNELYFNGAMPNPYDLALRERAVTAYERGEGSYAQLAALFDVDHRTLERWVARWRDTQSVAPQPRGGGWPCPIDVTVLRAVVRDGPDATVIELCWEYNRRVTRARRTARSSFHRALRRAGFVLKKNGRARAKLTDRMSPRNARRS